MQPLQNCIGPTIRIGRESWCLPYGGFFMKELVFLINSNSLKGLQPRLRWAATFHIILNKKPRVLPINNLCHQFPVSWCLAWHSVPLYHLTPPRGNFMSKEHSVWFILWEEVGDTLPHLTLHHTAIHHTLTHFNTMQYVYGSKLLQPSPMGLHH